MNMSHSSKPEFDQWTKWLKSMINWQKFATFLPGIKREHILKIENDNKGTDKQKSALYDEWTEIYPGATWQDVITALKEADNNALAEDIRKKLGGIPTQPTLTSPQALNKGATDVNIDRLRRSLQRVLKNQYAVLNSTLKANLQNVATEMFAKNLISDAVNEAPTYGSMIGEFQNGMQFQGSVPELENHCQLFLDSLISQGGPVERAAIHLAEEWKKSVNEDFGISLNLSV